MLGFGRILLLAIASGVCAGAQEQALREAAKLDAEGRCEQSEAIYRQALAKGSPSAVLLNNAGNHYLACGQPERARSLFEALLKANPAHQNANLQLGRMALERRQGEQAVAYLAKVTETGPGATLLRAEALHLAGKSAAAAKMLEGVQLGAKSDPRILFTLGLTAARIGLYGRAEAAFSEVASRMPADFDVMFNLGRAAFRAGHHDRAASALEAALKQRPREKSVLIELGRVYGAQQDYSRAVYVLARAREIAPGNAEVLFLLAHASEDAGFYGDAAMAYDEYLEQQPGDDQARLHRARVYCLTGARKEKGIKDLGWYVKKHPADPQGHFTLAQFIWERSPEAALDELSETLRLDGGFAPAHFARAWLLQRQGRMQESLPDLEAAARLAPGNVRALDQLGLTYLSLDRPVEAEKTLRLALAAGPNDREVLMHVGQALMALDREVEARQYFDRFRKTRAREVRDPRKEAGMIELATLAVEQRVQRQIDRLMKEAQDHPSQLELQLRLAQLLLSAGRQADAEAAFRELETRNADDRIWAEAGETLVRAEWYRMAIPFLRRAASGSPRACLDLAIALFDTSGPEEALKALEQTPAADRGGDWMLLQARILDLSGRKAEAEQALQQGLRLSVSKPQAARQAVMLLLTHGRNEEALSLVERAIRAAPANAELAMTKAVVLGALNRAGEAERALREIQSRWPEWDRSYLAHGLLLEGSGRKEPARKVLETAVVLNPQDRAARCALARLSGVVTEGADCACTTGLRTILFPGCEVQ